MNTFHKFFNLCIIVFLIIHVNKAYTENHVATAPEGLIATGHDSRIDLKWNPVNNCSGYNVYHASSSTGPFTRLNSSPYKLSVFSDFFGRNNKTYYYYVTSISGTESQPSATVSATSFEMTDEELLVSVQEATFRYFWDFAHPVSGLARERFAEWGREIVTTGGSGMGLMTLCVGVERGFVTRGEAAEFVLKMLTFLDTKAVRYHGVWSHWLNGTTGESIPFDPDGYDKGDVVETSTLVQGFLTVRQYFDANNPTETAIRTLADRLWKEVDWDWYRNGTSYLWWWWSPDPGVGFNGSFRFAGYNETMLTYLLAIGSPTHPIPASCYYDGWAGLPDYANSHSYYGYRQWVGRFEMPMFWTHYSFLGFDPRNKKDRYCNYFENSRHIALIDRAYCIDNPKGFQDYGESVWGLTSSYSPFGYVAHAPGSTDNGTITPTAAISSIPYTPAESIAALKQFYHTYGPRGLWGPLGFYDAFNPTENWFSNGYLAIDQGTIVPMIENYLTGFCWDVFMTSPEIHAALDAIPWETAGPAADFTAVPTSGPAPLTVQFTDRSSGDITSRSWDFGDGNSSTMTHPSHTYQNEGTYTVKLSVTGPDGSHTKTRAHYISVASGVSDNMLLNAHFSNGTTHWLFGYGTSASAGGSVENGEYVVSIANGGANEWDVNLRQSGLLIENGATYDASFDAYADASRSIVPYVGMSDSPWQVYGGYETVALSTEKQKYVYSFTMNQTTDPNAQFAMNVGGSNTDVRFDNMFLTKRSPSNILFNGAFSHGVCGWDFYVFSPAVAACSVENGEYHIAITNGGANGWDVHLQQQVLIENGVTYIFSFDAYAASPRQIIPFVAMSGEPWTIYGYRELMITTSKQTCTYSFTMTYATNPDARLVFDVGNSTADVYLDNISLTRGAQSPVEKETIHRGPKSFVLHQNYPNPFNPATQIGYQITDRSWVTLSIFTLHGQLVRTLVGEEQLAGSYSIDWDGRDQFGEKVPSAVYIYRLETNTSVTSKKMILME